MLEQRAYSTLLLTMKFSRNIANYLLRIHLDPEGVYLSIGIAYLNE